MHVGSAKSIGAHLTVAAAVSAAGSLAERFYGLILALFTTALIVYSLEIGLYPQLDARLILSVCVAALLLVGGELFVVAIPISWGSAQVSVGAICGLGVALWLGPVFATTLITVVVFVASLHHVRLIGVAIENGLSAGLSGATVGFLWWMHFPGGANPLTTIETSILFLIAAIMYTFINFGTVVLGAAIATKTPIRALVISMSSGGKNFLFNVPFLAAFVPLIGSESPVALLFFAVPLVSSHLALRALWRLESDTQITLAALTDILELRDPYTAFHSERVSIYSVAIARCVQIMSASELATLERAARIHDIGKAAVRDAVLLKTGPLTEGERHSIELHSSIGADLITRMHAYRECVELIRHHHERWDGGGYPSRLIGDRIPLGARIMAVADSLDAMTTDRPYRKALSFDEAKDEIRRNRNTQFDPDIVDAFFASLTDPAYDRLAEQSGSRLAAD